ncbi:MAG: hypothetical protein A2882_15480 [Phenylobacterium sp. RIFCSPHIGHO2_01_FULL_70_10]|jgi:hypothetical protein|nr:MAG: hypothetical protein A2882_15480 [Phenylobacterium sp. RIFCSPHIGHO2_01_FULL_70_10]
MISVIVPVPESDEALAGLFAVLVPAAVEGLVRDVVVVGGDASGATALLCEDAGARLVGGAISDAAQTVRGDWLLLVAPEMRFVSRWREALADHIAGSTRPALVLPPAESGWLAAFGRSQRAGLLIRKRDFGQPEGDLNRLRRRFGRGAVRLG